MTEAPKITYRRSELYEQVWKELKGARIGSRSCPMALFLSGSLPIQHMDASQGSSSGGKTNVASGDPAATAGRSPFTGPVLGNPGRRPTTLEERRFGWGKDAPSVLGYPAAGPFLATPIAGVGLRRNTIAARDQMILFQRIGVHETGPADVPVYWR